jgi:hypothetical protein
LADAATMLDLVKIIRERGLRASIVRAPRSWMIERPLVYPFYAEEHLRRDRTVLRADDPAARLAYPWTEIESCWMALPCSGVSNPVSLTVWSSRR